MRTSNTARTAIVAAALIICVAGIASAEEPGRRGFLLQLGVEAPFVSYGTSVDSLLSSYTTNGLSRIDLGLNASLGYAVVQDLYIVATAGGHIEQRIIDRQQLGLGNGGLRGL